VLREFRVRRRSGSERRNLDATDGPTFNAYDPFQKGLRASASARASVRFAAEVFQGYSKALAKDRRGLAGFLRTRFKDA
jgi:hypothetical protein